MSKRVYVGYVEGQFSAWILCKTCHKRVYFPPAEEPERVTCECGVTAKLSEYRRPFKNGESK
jgi:hypothetical protein